MMLLKLVLGCILMDEGTLSVRFLPPGQQPRQEIDIFLLILQSESYFANSAFIIIYYISREA